MRQSVTHCTHTHLTRNLCLSPCLSLCLSPYKGFYRRPSVGFVPRDPDYSAVIGSRAIIRGCRGSNCRRYTTYISALFMTMLMTTAMCSDISITGPGLSLTDSNFTYVKILNNTYNSDFTMFINLSLLILLRWAVKYLTVSKSKLISIFNILNYING